MKRRNGRGAKAGQGSGAVKDTAKEAQPSTVPARAKQGGEIPARWAWVEPTVWTTRMLAALENGVKGGRWFSLMDKVYAPANLAAAWKRVRDNRGAAGVDHQSVGQFDTHAAKYLDELHGELREGRYRPRPVRRQWIPKPGTNQQRPLGIPTVRDRIVQSALRHVLEPIWEAKFVDQSYGFRPERSGKDALRRVQTLLHDGYTWVVDADIQSYYDSIDRGRLLDEVAGQVADGKVLQLVEAMLAQPVMEEASRWTPEEGIPQGSTLGPLLANVYLHPVDEEVVRAGYELTRYADDLVVLCRSEQEAIAALALLRDAMTRRGLTLHPEKTRVVDMSEPGGFDFLGYHFERDKKWPRRKSLMKLKDNVRGLTKRNNGHCMQAIIARLNPVLRGWFEYFKHSYRTTFAPVDSWVRMRLRSILRRRHRQRGAGRGWSNIRWPNGYFAKLGLFTMTTAREIACQSLQRVH
jgi:RNA-directed DNA polymerase